MSGKDKLLDVIDELFGHVLRDGCDHCGKKPTELIALWREDQKQFCSGKCAMQWSAQHPAHPLRPLEGE